MTKNTIIKVKFFWIEFPLTHYTIINNLNHLRSDDSAYTIFFTISIRRMLTIALGALDKGIKIEI
jgi:hypothetical protein